MQKSCLSHWLKRGNGTRPCYYTTDACARREGERRGKSGRSGATPGCGQATTRNRAVGQNKQVSRSKKPSRGFKAGQNKTFPRDEGRRSGKDVWAMGGDVVEDEAREQVPLADGGLGRVESGELGPDALLLLSLLGSPDSAATLGARQKNMTKCFFFPLLTFWATRYRGTASDRPGPH